MALSLDEFLRRFLLHRLPKAFVRIRHFGFLASRRRTQLLPLCLAALESLPAQTETATSTAQDISSHWLCPQCGRPHGDHRAINCRSDPTSLSTQAVHRCSMKSLSHFEKFACPAALVRRVSCHRKIRSFARLMINATPRNTPRTPYRSTSAPLPRRPSPCLAHMQSP